MGISLPKLSAVLEGDAGGRSDKSPLRRTRRVSTPPGQTAPPPVASRPPRGTPTLQSLAAAKLAEEETRLAKTGVDDARHAEKKSVDGNPRSGISSSGHRFDAVRELYAEGQANAALALASEIPPELEPDPFGGLILVEDEPEASGGLVQDTGRGQDFAGFGELNLDLDDPSVPVPSVPDGGLSLECVPRLLVGMKDLSTLPMDPRAAFILSHVDGRQSMEEILDVCPMPRAEALETIERLCSMGVLRLD